MDINLNKEFNNILSKIDLSNKPNLFLHVCCGPCSTSVLDRIFNYFNIYIIFANSNIDTFDEFILRYNEFLKVLTKNNYNFKIIFNQYDHKDYLSFINGLEKEPEGGKRCIKCFEYRLKQTFFIADNYIINNKLMNKQNYLCTTLSVSPHKNAGLIESIGENVCMNSNYIKYLPSDFKKENGYLKSIQLSKQYNLYRQNYCGCEFSKLIK